MFEFFDHDQDTTTATSRSNTPGQVRFDERGNAVYAWHDAQLEEDSRRAEKMRERALLHPGLSLVAESPTNGQASLRNDQGARLGYNPYESGQLPGKKVTRKRDMRELSKWIEMKRRMAAQSTGTTSED